MLHRLRRPEISERLQPLFFIGYCLWLCFHYNDVFDSTPAYQKAAILPEYAWLLIFGLTGVLQFYATWTGRLYVRRKALFWSSIVWAVWTLAVFLAFTKGFGIITYGGMTVLTFCTWVEAQPSPGKF